MTRRFRLVRLACCASLCLLGSARLEAKEQHLKVDVRLHAPTEADCIRKAELDAALTKQQPPVVVDAQQPDVVIDVDFARREAGDGWRALLRVSSPNGEPWGERALDGAGNSCRSTTEELEFMIGLAAQGTLLEAPADQPKPAAAKAAEPAPIAVPPKKRPAPIVRRVERWQVALDTLVLGSVRLLPSPAPGAELGAVVAAPFNAGARLRVNGYVPQELVAGAGRASASYVSTSGAVCPLLTRGRVRGDACLGLAWAVLGVSSTGLENARSSRRSLLEGLLSSALLLQLMPSWWVGAYAELVVPLKRDRYVVAQPPLEPERLLRLPPYSLALGIGARVAL